MAVMNITFGVSTNNTSNLKSKNKKKRESQKRVRVSKRILKKNAEPNGDIKSVSRTVELAKSPIDTGNPKQKLLFLTALGLTPKSTTKIMPPFVRLHRMELSTLPKVTSNAKHSVPIVPRFAEYSSESSVLLESSRLPEESDDDDTEKVAEYTDTEDLDLELLICPFDIPEFFEELFVKKSPNKNANSSSNNQSNNTSKDIDEPVQKKYQKPKSIKQSSMDTYLLPKQRKNLSSRQEIPFIDLTGDDEILCQGIFSL